jgi:hypothetical protein
VRGCHLITLNPNSSRRRPLKKENNCSHQATHKSLEMTGPAANVAKMQAHFIKQVSV